MMNVVFRICRLVQNKPMSVRVLRDFRRVSLSACAQAVLAAASLLVGSQANASGGFPLFTSKGFIQAGDASLQVTSYSAPSYADWNADGLPDMIVGEKNGSYGKVRIYPNHGTQSAPVFSDYFFASNASAALSFPASGCLGVFPQLFDWNGDGKLDFLAGLADGTIQVLLNENTAENPIFGASALLQAGADGQKNTITVYSRATLTLADWNNDGKTDLIVGALDGKIRVYLNDAATGVPNYRAATVVKMGASDLSVPSGRSCPVVWDIDGDGKKDLVSGNTDGQIAVYLNTGADASPAFDAMQYLKADDQPIFTGSQRSRLCLGDWNGDGLPDLIVGGADGLLRLYQQKPSNPAVIRFSSIQRANGACLLEITGAQGLNIEIERTSSFSEPLEWFPLLATNSPAVSLVITQDTTANPKGFFRVRQTR